MRKYIFLDIDGTLLGKGGAVPPSAASAIAEAQRAGHKVYLCTGRSKGEVPRVIWELGMDGIVGSAGAYVESDGKILYHKPMQQELVKKLADYLDSQGSYYAMETNGKAFITEENMKKMFHRFQSSDFWTDEIKEEFLESFQVCDNVREVEGVNKCIYHECQDSFARMQEKLPEFTILPSSIEDSGENNGEISEKGMSKAKGIEVLQKHFGIRREDIICFGDGLNDMEMIALAGAGVAMGNGVEELKQIADYVTADVDADGLIKGFYKLGLIG